MTSDRERETVENNVSIYENAKLALDPVLDVQNKVLSGNKTLIAEISRPQIRSNINGSYTTGADKRSKE